MHFLNSDINLSGQMYVDLLENAIFPSMVQSSENQVDEKCAMEPSKYNDYFQKNVAPFLYALSFQE